MKSILCLLIGMLSLVTSSNAAVVVVNGLTHRHELAKGVMEEGSIILKNTGKSPQRVVVYLNDMATSCESDNLDLQTSGSLPRSMGKWITTNTNERVLAPGEEFPLRYTITPPNEEVEGSYWSLILIEVKSPIDTSVTSQGVKVTTGIRYAVQVIGDFASSQPTSLNFESAGYEKNQQTGGLKLKLKNTCHSVLSPELQLEIYDEAGELITTGKCAAQKLYPAQCKDFFIPIKAIPPGHYQAVVVADCSDEDLFGITINLDIDD